MAVTGYTVAYAHGNSNTGGPFVIVEHNDDTVGPRVIAEVYTKTKATSVAAALTAAL